MMVQPGFQDPSSFLFSYHASPTAKKVLELIASSPLLKGLKCDLVMVGEPNDEHHCQVQPVFLCPDVSYVWYPGGVRGWHLKLTCQLVRGRQRALPTIMSLAALLASLRTQPFTLHLFRHKKLSKGLPQVREIAIYLMR